MAIFGPLSIGRHALLTHQRALQVTGHNIANVNTPGFSRQRVQLEAIPPNGDRTGTGVRVAGVDRIVDPFIEARQLANGSAFGDATATRDLLQRLEANFPVTGGGIGDALQEFFATANAVAADPASLAARGELVSAAESLTARIREGAGAFSSFQREADARFVQGVRDSNALLERVASLNREVVAARVAGSSDNDLQDLRQEALRDLSQQLQINVVEQADGAVNVFARTGTALVLGSSATNLQTEPSTTGALDGGTLSRLGVVGDSGAFIPIGTGFGGALGALETLRDTTFVQGATALDALADGLRLEVNAVQAAGFDLDGLPGGDLFAGTGAADLTVALADSRGIAAAQGANPADNTNALDLVAVQDNRIIAGLGGQTLGEYFGTFHAGIGQQTRSASDQAIIEEQVAGTLAAQRDSVSGVSLEEEFTDLIRYQRAFQAAAQLISVSNSMLDDLIGLVR